VNAGTTREGRIDMSLRLAALAALALVSGRISAEESVPPPTAAVCLDGPDWLLATDAKNAGIIGEWFRAPRPEAKAAKVPWIIQDPFPGYHGVAWYWRTFDVPANPRPSGRTLLRFWAVDYKADVWVNGRKAGEHEDAETPFVLDITGIAKPGEKNLLAVRVVNPIHQPIDGLVLAEIPHRNKALPYSAGSAWDQGGIVDSVELLLAPAVRVEDLFARGNWETGEVRVRAAIRNTTDRPAKGRLEISIAPASGGEAAAEKRIEVDLPPGESVSETSLEVPGHRLWELNDPFLYRLTARIAVPDPAARDEASTRFGFRDFRFRDGAFRLNGRRIYLRCSHTGNACPVGLEMPHDPDYLRRDLVNAKMMGFNAIRFISGVARRYQLDMADDIGFMIYEEPYGAWCLADSPHMARRYTKSVLGMVLRDRNHPSVTMWGLLNETPDGAVFRQAVKTLPALRALDDSRLVLLNSGSWQSGGGSVAGLEAWRDGGRTDPCVTRNATDHVIKALGITWAPGGLSFHPGRDGEHAVVRWTAPGDGEAAVTATFESIAERATTDVHVLRGNDVLFAAGINVRGGGRDARWSGKVTVKAGDAIDCAVGYGNGDYGADSTGLAFKVKLGAQAYDAARDFAFERNPQGPWSYGKLAPGGKPDPATFSLFTEGGKETSIGSLSNPGSPVWEDVMSDIHPYQRVPHTAGIIDTLRTIGGNGLPVFLSEYGIGSAADLIRIARHFECLGKTDVEDARLYRSWLDGFLADWERWRMVEAFARPEDFFARSKARMGSQRLLGLNAIRANPNVVGHSVTGTVDQGMSGEGLWTPFRELKPGTADAVFEGFAPLRLCLFVEPVTLYRGGKARIEAVLADEDVLRKGSYPLRLLVTGPGPTRVFERTLTVEVSDPAGKPERPMVRPLFSEEVTVDGPPGKYRFLADFLRGAAAAGGETEFHVYDPKEMPAVEVEATLFGDDEGLARWLGERGIRARPFGKEPPAGREAILASGRPPEGGAAPYRDLAGRIARGSTAVFLSPSVLARKDAPGGWVPLARKGRVEGLPSWLYHKDDWAKIHPIFEGLPAGDLLDYTVYREIIPDGAWVGLDPPDEAVAGANNASIGYSSGLTVAVYKLGEGRFVLNSLAIRENLGPSPVAERLLRNLLRWTARDAGKPPAALPADFDRRLEAIGYGGD
jgi:hypothetical protein